MIRAGSSPNFRSFSHPIQKGIKIGSGASTSHLVQGDPNLTKFEATADRIVTTISFLRLFSRELHFEKIVVHSPTVIVTEGPLRSPSSDPKQNEPSPRWTFYIGGIEANNGTFTYVHLYKPHDAAIHVTNIDARTEEWGNSPRLKHQVARGHARGYLEKSGAFILDLATTLTPTPMYVDLKLHLSEQNLSDLNAYFNYSDGITLAGMLYDGQTEIKIREKNLSGWVHANYKNLDIHFSKTKDRGSVATFFSNLVKSIKLDASDVGEPSSEQTRAVELQRKERESIINFILRGMKDAALKVASS